MNEENNNPTDSSSEIPSGSKGSSMNFTAMKDLMVPMTYSCASEDSVTGAKQKEHISNLQLNMLTS